MEKTAMEIIMEDIQVHNHDTSNCVANLSLQHKNQNWETSYAKSELDLSTRSTSCTGTPDNSHCSETMDEENICPYKGHIYNRDTLHNGSYNQETLDHNMDINTSDDLRQFDVLDDLDRHPEQNYSDADSETDESMDSDVPDEEIEAMLEEGIF